MGLAETVLTRPAPKEEGRALQITPWGPWDPAGGGSATGVNVVIENALQLLTVYGCVQLIADTIATLPRDIYRKRSDGVNEDVLPVPGWFEQPNDRTDIIEFLTQSLLSLLLDGNAYWAYSTDLNMSPTEIHVLDPTRVDPRLENRQIVFYVDGVPFRGRMLHIKGLTRPGKLKGLSPLENARQSIGLGLGAQEFASRFYSNGVTMSGVVSTPGDLTQDQARDLRQNISRDHGGLKNAHLPGVLTNGATWTSISITPEQAQFLQAREFQAAEIAAQLFLLDPSMLGIASAGTRGQNLTYANLEQRGIHLVQFTLLRWMIRLERAFTFLLPRPQFMKFNADALQRADLKTRFEAHRIALGPNQPFEKLNEVRALEDYVPVPGGDKLQIVTPTPTPGPPISTFTPPAPAKPSTNGHVKIEHVRAPDVTINNQIVAPTTRTVIRDDEGRVAQIVEHAR